MERHERLTKKQQYKTMTADKGRQESREAQVRTFGAGQTARLRWKSHTGTKMAGKPGQEEKLELTPGRIRLSNTTGSNKTDHVSIFNNLFELLFFPDLIKGLLSITAF